MHKTTPLMINLFQELLGEGGLLFHQSQKYRTSNETNSTHLSMCTAV